MLQKPPKLPKLKLLYFNLYTSFWDIVSLSVTQVRWLNQNLYIHLYSYVKKLRRFANINEMILLKSAYDLLRQWRNDYPQIWLIVLPWRFQSKSHLKMLSMYSPLLKNICQKLKISIQNLEIASPGVFCKFRDCIFPQVVEIVPSKIVRIFIPVYSLKEIRKISKHTETLKIFSPLILVLKNFWKKLKFLKERKEKKNM